MWRHGGNGQVLNVGTCSPPENPGEAGDGFNFEVESITKWSPSAPFILTLEEALELRDM